MSAPDNFSWISKSVAGFAFPITFENAEYLDRMANVNHVITLCSEKPAHIIHIKWHYFPVKDFQAPSQKTVEDCLKIIDHAESNNQRVGIHCLMGQGRTNTILACYMIKKQGLSGEQAIRTVREMRPRFMESEEQLECIQQYAQRVSHYR